MVGYDRSGAIAPNSKIMNSSSMNLSDYIAHCYQTLPALEAYSYPWHIIDALKSIIGRHIQALSEEEYEIGVRDKRYDSHS